MTKPQRQHGAVRQLGAINKILRPEPQAQHRGLKPGPDSRFGAQHDRSLESCGRAQKRHGNYKQQGDRVAGPNVSEQSQPYQPTKLQNGMMRDAKPERSSPVPRSSQSPYPRGVQRRLHMPQQEQSRSSAGIQAEESKPDGHDSKSIPRPEASGQNDNANQLGLKKRKRSSVDDGDGGGCDQASKKQQVARPNVLQMKQQVNPTSAIHCSNVTNAAAAPRTTTNKHPGQVVRKVHTRQSSSTSSDRVPGHNVRPLKSKNPIVIESNRTTTPQPVEKLPRQQTPPEAKSAAAPCDERESIRSRSRESKSNPAVSEKATTPSLPSDTSTHAHQTRTSAVLLPSSPSSSASVQKKRCRDSSDDAEPACKRLRRLTNGSSSPLSLKNERPALVTEGVHQAFAGVAGSPSTCRTPPHQPPRPREIPPDDLFAPVTPNPECDFVLLDYDHESVPVLYSDLIKHTNGIELLNCPPEELVFDALDAIEAGFKPFSKYGWPTAIDPLGRTPSKNNPTKVLKDVDLYLHEKDGKLYVATDRGLIIVAEYLKLIGIPETQPVRFDGRIPPWAKVGLQTREKRKVVQVFGKLRKVKKVKQELKVISGTENVMRDSEATGQEAKKVKAAQILLSNRATEEEVEYEELLKAERPGDLPLPLGSSVIVYKIDHNDEWAYGRSCDSGEKGWFPISHTCPIDWSLDRFAGSRAGLLDKPLPMSQDPEEKGWNGIIDYIRQQGFPEGPTWKQVCAATASTAARTHAISRAIADLNTTRSCTAGTSTPRAAVALKGIDTPAKKSSSHMVSSSESHIFESEDVPITVSREGTTAIPATRASSSAGAETSTDEDHSNASDPETLKRTEETNKPDTNLVNAEHAARPAPQVLESPVQVADVPEAEQEAVAESSTGSITMVGNEVDNDDHRAARRSAAQEPEILEGAESASTAPAHNPFTVPRYDPFARNDDIEYDWDDSDDEEL
ncbi:hypothetical protein M3J09_013420 [Ascochyta lentis]